MGGRGGGSKGARGVAHRASLTRSSLCTRKTFWWQVNEKTKMGSTCNMLGVKAGGHTSAGAVQGTSACRPNRQHSKSTYVNMIRP